MYEHRSRPLISRIEFLFRVLRHGLLATVIIIVALSVGVLGYHEFGGLPWLDATLNASMILSGMGPVNELKTVSGKTFAAAYALFSGIVFVGIMGVLLAPFAHRLLHRFHLEAEGKRGRDAVEK